jgi:hypothetical protein
MGQRFNLVGRPVARLWPLAVALAALPLLLGNRPVQAACVTPTYRIIWSYPADGAVDVPTNARLFILTPFGLDTGELRVSGQSVKADPMDSRLGFNLGMTPHTEYVVAIDRGPGVGGASLRFTTGGGPIADVLPAPPIIGKATAMRDPPLSSVCQQARNIGFCFDTGGDPGQLVLETKSQAVIFLLRWQPPVAYPEWVPQSSEPPRPYTIHWPATCGQPATFGSTSTCFGSYRVSAVGITGESVSRDYVCPEPRDPRTDVAGQGCSTGGADRTGGAGNCALLLLLLLAGLRVVSRR